MMLGITGSMWSLWSSGADYATLLPAIVGGVGGLWVLFGGWKTISVVIKTLPRLVEQNHRFTTFSIKLCNKITIKKYFRNLSHNHLSRDLKAVSKLVRLGLHVKRAERQNLTVPKVFKR